MFSNNSNSNTSNEPEVKSASDLERFHEFCRRDSSELLAELIKSNNKLINEKSNIGFTGLMYAALTGANNSLLILLQNKADINAVNNNGKILKMQKLRCAGLIEF
jgi:ankyrin repeat protein